MTTNELDKVSGGAEVDSSKLMFCKIVLSNSNLDDPDTLQELKKGSCGSLISEREKQSDTFETKEVPSISFDLNTKGNVGFHELDGVIK